MANGIKKTLLFGYRRSAVDELMKTKERLHAEERKVLEKKISEAEFSRAYYLTEGERLRKEVSALKKEEKRLQKQIETQARTIQKLEQQLKQKEKFGLLGLLHRRPAEE